MRRKVPAATTPTAPETPPTSEAGATVPRLLAVNSVEFHVPVEMWPGIALKVVEVGKPYKRYLGNVEVCISAGEVVVDPVPGIVLDGVTYPMTSILRYS